MPSGARVLALLDSKEEKKKFQQLLYSLPRFLRPEIEDLVVRTHASGGFHNEVLDCFYSLEVAGEFDESKIQAVLDVAYRQLGEDRDAPVTSAKSQADKVEDSPEATARLRQLVTLKAILNACRKGWFMEMVCLPREKCDRLIEYFTEMTLKESQELAQVAQHLPRRLEELLELYEQPSDGRDTLTDLERAEHQMISLHLNSTGQGEGITAASLLGPPPRKAVGDFSERRDLVLSVGSEAGTSRGEEDTMVLKLDTLSATLGIRAADPVALDTSTMNDRTRHGIYQFVSEMGNNYSLHDKTGRDKTAIMQAQADLGRAKAKWWAKEAAQVKLRRVKEKVMEVQKNIRARAHREKLAAAARAEQARKDDEEYRHQREVAHAVAKALEVDEKWVKFEQRREQHEVNQRKILHDLETATVGILPEEQPTQRQQDGKSYLHKEWTAGGLPLTAAAASHTFGTVEYEERDVSAEVNGWACKAKKKERLIERRRKHVAATLASSKKEGFSQQVAQWKAESKELEDARRQRMQREKEAKEMALEARAKHKAMLYGKRLEMRGDASERERERSRLEAAEARRKAEEENRQERERKKMMMQEARQCVVDRYWGIPTQQEYVRRVEAWKRKVWAAKAEDKNVRMVQVGNTDAETWEETEKLRFDMEVMAPSAKRLEEAERFEAEERKRRQEKGRKGARDEGWR